MYGLITHPAKKLLLLLDTNTPSHDVNAAFIDFCVYFNRLTLRFARTPIQDRHLMDVILSKPDLSKPNVFQKHIYAANASFQRLYKEVFPSTIRSYTHIIKTLLFDIYDIISQAEDFKANGDPLSWGSRDEQTGREIFDAARTVFYIQAVDTSTAYLREVTPASIFLIRQSLEVLGKNIIGFSTITGRQHRYKNTNVAWDYIRKDQAKAMPLIRLPIEFSSVAKIIEWTNGYIHTGRLKDYYIIENVISVLLKLYFRPAGTVPLPNYRNSVVLFGVVQVSQYKQVKQEFTEHINSADKPSWWKRVKIFLRIEKAPAGWQVVWIDPERLKEVSISSL